MSGAKDSGRFGSGYADAVEGVFHVEQWCRLAEGGAALGFGGWVGVLEVEHRMSDSAASCRVGFVEREVMAAGLAAVLCQGRSVPRGTAMPTCTERIWLRSSWAGPGVPRGTGTVGPVVAILRACCRCWPQRCRRCRGWGGAALERAVRCST